MLGIIIHSGGRVKSGQTSELLAAESNTSKGTERGGSKDDQMMYRTNPVMSGTSALSWAKAISIAVGCLAMMAIDPGTAAAQTTPRLQNEDSIIAQWRPSLESYIRKLEGESYRGGFVVEGYLGQLDWGGDKYEEVSPGRYFAFSVRFQDVNPLVVEVITTRAILIDDSGKIVGDIEYPNSHLVWPGTHQPYLFGIPALRPTVWSGGNGGGLDWAPAGGCPRVW
jgi:hypothetical protein